MDWEIISNDLGSYSPKEKTSPIGTPTSLSTTHRITPSRKKEFKPTPTPPPLEIDKKPAVYKKNKRFPISLGKIFYIGAMMYLFSEIYKKYLNDTLNSL